ncbi:hypothetical protein [Iningainema tapete]|uniref:Uncharacterized protein n=1 Tax=Iningainema tapete BLCC-T55 TaxID=2748662 RepID=A0A8J6XQL0_9CYAN|nr:hypothetical protein [Iningainema tapete]MBD2775581.1 hypothetical protein [Iningainema tapete BLCC-T55]
MLGKTPLIWFVVVKRTYPWAMVITVWRVISSSGIKRHREKARFFLALVKIDFAGIISLMNDLIM